MLEFFGEAAVVIGLGAIVLFAIVLYHIRKLD